VLNAKITRLCKRIKKGTGSFKKGTGSLAAAKKEFVDLKQQLASKKVGRDCDRSHTGTHTPP